MGTRDATVWLGVAIAAACSGPAFECADDADCSRSGICESTGFCSFPDAGCDSGRRYGTHAGALSQTCVPVDETSGIAESASGSGEVGSTIASETATSVDTSSATDPATGTTGDIPPGTSSSDEGSTGVPMSPCTSEAFDDEDLDGDLCVFSTPGLIDTQIVGAELRVPLVPNDWGIGVAADGGVTTCVPTNLAGIDLAAELVAVANGPISHTQVGLSDGMYGAGMTVRGGYIGSYSSVGTNVQLLQNEPYDPMVHRYVRVEHDVDVGSLRFYHSSDGMIWTLVNGVAIVLDIDQAVVVVAAGAPDNPLQADQARFDDVTICFPD